MNFPVGAYQYGGYLRIGCGDTYVFCMGKRASGSTAGGTPTYYPQNARKIQVGQVRRRLTGDLFRDSVEALREYNTIPEQAA